MITALLTLLAGMLTVVAPCILPLLPVILGGSVASGATKWRPYIIITSLVVSVIAFTFLLKVSTALLGVDPLVWKVISGGIVITLGVFMLFPGLWARLSGALGFEHRSQELLAKASEGKKSQWLSAILTGAALAPVFSSCSPTYAWVIATVLPRSLAEGTLYLFLYCLGLGLALLAVALLGQKILKKARWALNPYGWFQRTIAVLFIVVGIFVITGLDKTMQTYLVEQDFLGSKQLERLITPEQ